MKRRNLPAIVIGICVLLLAALAYFLWGRPQKTSDNTIEFWHIQNYSPTKEVIEAAVKRFEAAHPGITVKINAIKNDQYKTQLQTAFAAGNPPDVFHTWGGGVLGSYYSAGQVRPLSGLFADVSFKSRFAEAAIPFCYIEGTPVCVPADVGVVLFFYNKKIFADLKLNIPQRIADFCNACVALKEAGYAPIALGNAEQWPGCFFYDYSVIRAMGKRDVERAASLSDMAFAAPPFHIAACEAMNFANNGYFCEGYQGMKVDSARRLFFTRKAGMMLMGNWLVANAKEEAPDIIPELGVFPYPIFGEPESTVLGGVNCAYAISSACKNPKLAEDLLKSLTDTAFAKQWAGIGRIPAVKGAEQADFIPITYEAYQILLSSSSIQMYLDQLYPPELGAAHKEAVQQVLSLKLHPDALHFKMEEAAKKLKGR